MDPKIPVQSYVESFLAHEEYLTPTTLCAIMTSCGSDKGDIRHNYTTLYSKLFSQWKEKDINLFELGLGTNNLDVPSNMGSEGKPGASLYGWSIYFPKAHIYGADIDKRVLFNDQNIKTYYCDQLDENSIKELFEHPDLKDLQFDIIIEDGLHQFEANLIFLWNSIAKLKKGGIYIVEDLNELRRESFKMILPHLQSMLSLSYINIVTIPSPFNQSDNTLLVIQK